MKRFSLKKILVWLRHGSRVLTGLLAFASGCSEPAEFGVRGPAARMRRGFNLMRARDKKVFVRVML